MGLEGNLCLNMVLLIKGIAEHFRKNEESCCNFKESRTVGFFLFFPAANSMLANNSDHKSELWIKLSVIHFPSYELTAKFEYYLEFFFSLLLTLYLLR